MKILSIDDSRSVHAYIQQCLLNTECEISHAYNGEEGLRSLEGSEDVDLILLDWEMPVMTGPEVAASLKKMGNKIPVIMLTSKNAPEDISQMLELGVSEYVMKPFTPDILIDKIEAITGERIMKHGPH